MKLIGLLGGMSWVATGPYYNRLNELVVERLGVPHSARILMYSVDYAPMKSLYHHGWDKIPGIFAQEYKRLAAAKPDCIILACNTVHKAYDLVAKELPQDIPFLHAVHLTRDYCMTNGVKRPLFVGTEFTMNDGYFMEPLRAAGLELSLPSASEMKQVQEAQTAIAQGKATAAHKDFFAKLIASYPQTDGVILACTELPLIAPPSQPNRPIINPAELQCVAAVNFSLQ